MNTRNIRTLTMVFAIIILLLMTGCPDKTPKTPKGPDASDIEANNRGVALMGRFDFEGAQKIFAELSGRRPGNLDIKTNLAIAIINRQKEGDEQKAFDILQQILQVDKNNMRARYCTSLLELHMGRPEKALEHLKAVLETDPDDAEGLYFAGKSLTQLSRHEEAVNYFKRVLKIDPYVSSAYYGMIMAMRQSGQTAEAMSLIEEYNRIKENPRVRIVEFKYTKMGKKAEALAIDQKSAPPVKKPSGALFKEAKPIALTEDLQWRQLTGKAGSYYGGVTVSDINGDGFPDIFMPGAGVGTGVNALLFGNTDPGKYSPAKDHPLAAVADVNTALWGDVDDDGLIDVYLCRKGKNQLWKQAEKGKWEEVTGTTRTGGGDFNTVDGALFDADHDGDLDIFVVNSDGPNELFNNDRDGEFSPLAEKYGLMGGKTSSRQIAIADLDKDRDADIIIINEEAPHEVYLNERLWKYHQAEGFGNFENSDIKALAPGDLDSDGKPELYVLDSMGTVSRWARGSGAGWKASIVREGKGKFSSNPRLELADFDGDGAIDIIASTRDGWEVLASRDGRLTPLFNGPGDEDSHQPPGFSPSLFETLVNTVSGPAVLGSAAGGPPHIYLPGPGRFSFVSLKLSGRRDPDSNLRSNSSGIGAYLSARTGSRWSVTNTFRKGSGPGQGLQPLLLGLGGASKMDFISIDWPDGVFQTEMDLLPGETIIAVETQRQMSSCPVLFAWNGKEFTFVSDILGVGGIGYAVGPGIYAESRPWENFIFPQEVLKPRDGKLIVKITEPMEEVEYLDAARLKAYDLPPGWHMTLDERMGINGPPPTGKTIFYRKMMLSVKAVNERNEDVTDKVVNKDMAAAPVGPLDRRFIGMLEEDHVLTLTFGEALDSVPGNPTLVIDGWVEYPYSQTSFAAWQAEAEYRAPTLEAKGEDGEWIVVLDQFGYPAGMPRQMSVPLADLPAGTKELRISTNQEVYWDKIAVAFAEPCPEVKVHDLELETARLEETGFPLRTDLAQRRPHYDYSKRSPLWDSRRLEGYYTSFGDVMELLEKADNALAVIGPGEGVHMEFKAANKALPDGWTRRYVIETEGWCKDMDLFTNTGETVEPLPRRGEVSEEARSLNGRYNTRYLSGRM